MNLISCMKKVALATLVGTIAVGTLVSCGKKESGLKFSKTATSESIIKEAASAGKVGNWGGGNEYEVLALLKKYNQGQEFISQAFDMDGFDDGSIALASAMTYNELGLVKNSYTGGYKYGDTVGTIDMNDEGVAMLEDNIFCKKSYAVANPNTVKAFLRASMKGWAYAVANPEEAAQIVFTAGSSVSQDHQSFMAAEVAKLVKTDTAGNTVAPENYGKMIETAMAQTLALAKQYVTLSDATAATKLSNMTLDDIRDNQYIEAAMGTDPIGAVEDSDVTIQLKWLNQAQFMGYFVAKSKGYYSDLGLTVTIAQGGGDIAETTSVNNGTAEFGVTWVTNLTAANAGGMDLLQIAQVYQRSGLVLVYKYAD